MPAGRAHSNQSVVHGAHCRAQQASVTWPKSWFFGPTQCIVSCLGTTHPRRVAWPGTTFKDRPGGRPGDLHDLQRSSPPCPILFPNPNFIPTPPPHAMGLTPSMSSLRTKKLNQSRRAYPGFPRLDLGHP
jgi:hypothetical protein